MAEIILEEAKYIFKNLGMLPEITHFKLLGTKI
jgi:hypothetical protein